MKNSGPKLLILVFLAMSVCIAPALPPLVNAQEEGSRQKLTSHYQKALNIIRDNYVVEIDNETLTKTAIQGMLKSLDPHSDYLDRKAFQEFNEKQHSQYFGIGSNIRTINRVTYIVEPFKGSPASRAGLHYGDHIVAVDGKDTSTWSSDRVRTLLLGDRGTQVIVSVKRAGVKDPITATITRDAIWLPSIPNYYMVKSNVGYIGLTRNFQSTTYDELKSAMVELREKGADSFILDLRGNGGGYLDQAIKVSDQFLQRGQQVVSVRGRSGNDKNYLAENGASENFPLVVLIDRYTASASEIVAGSIQDHDRGLIIGESSFGKGLVQRIFPLNDGGALTLTIAHYYTPSGRLIQRDYSNGSLFEYYARRNGDGDTYTTQKPRTDEKKTDLGRTVYGGGGIDPDIKLENSDFANAAQTTMQNRLFHGLCLFTRELIAGQVAGHSQIKLTTIGYDYKVKGNELIISDDLLKQYRDFVVKFYKENPEYGVTAANVDENLPWARKQMRQEALVAFYGADKAQQVMADLDPQLQRAVTEMPKAADLSVRSWRRGTTSMRQQ
ncbi:MAG TPA: S41 family peptidase [Blastocatellia bacterium]|nr:S41 family peptidase [Blastocatellia bacterium]